METAVYWYAWLAQWAAWILGLWFLGAFVIGIPVIIWDEIRFRRTAPKPAEVAAYADQLEAAYGLDARSVVGEAIHVARKNGDSQTRRFLEEVSRELFRRLVERQPAGAP